jgi:acetylornithine deacetylase
MNMEPVVKLLQELVAIPSMNPMGRARFSDEYSEEALAQYLAAFLKRRGLDVQLQQIAPRRLNVLASIEVHAPRTILLEAHLDTVHAENMKIAPFDPVIREDKMYGRGVCDTKGSLATFVQASLNALEKKSLHSNVILLFVADEEYQFTGARYAVQNGLRADYGIAGEPTRLRIVHAHKGVTRWRVWTRGRAAHSAYPERGENAIYRMADVLQRLEQYAKNLTRSKPHPVLGTPTLSVGVIEGGQAVNVVPDRCWIEIDRRSLPGETAERIVAETRKFLNDLSDWEFDEPHLSVEGMEVSKESEVVQQLATAIEAVTGTAMLEAAPYATDAGIYHAAGIPTVVFGPGDIAQAHTDEEYIDLQQVHQAVQIMERFLAG